MGRQQILTDIDKERAYQVKRWGNYSDDTQNFPNDWVSYIAQYATRWHKGQFAPYTKENIDEFRECMIKTAAIAVAAVESLDRQREADGNAFYERKGE